MWWVTEVITVAHHLALAVECYRLWCNAMKFVERKAWVVFRYYVMHVAEIGEYYDEAEIVLRNIEDLYTRCAEEYVRAELND